MVCSRLWHLASSLFTSVNSEGQNNSRLTPSHGLDFSSYHMAVPVLGRFSEGCMKAALF